MENAFTRSLLAMVHAAMRDQERSKAYAVPIDFTFEPAPKDVTVAELVASYEEQHGCKVKVSE
jgi:hypothetical protein